MIPAEWKQRQKQTLRSMQRPSADNKVRHNCLSANQGKTFKARDTQLSVSGLTLQERTFGSIPPIILNQTPALSLEYLPTAFDQSRSDCGDDPRQFMSRWRREKIVPCSPAQDDRRNPKTNPEICFTQRTRGVSMLILALDLLQRKLKTTLRCLIVSVIEPNDTLQNERLR